MANRLPGGDIEWLKWFTSLDGDSRAIVNAVVSRKSTELFLAGGSFTALPERFGLLLGTLTVLNLTGCSFLTVLPESLGFSRALVHLYLGGCSSLTVLPESIGQLRAVTELYLTRCPSLTVLPESFGQLGALTVLDLQRCSFITVLPESFGLLRALTVLSLRGCSSITVLPESFGKLGALTRLFLQDCSSLAVLPESFGQLRVLTSLHLAGCFSLTELPESFGQLRALAYLDLAGCSLNSATRAWAHSLLNRNRIINRTISERSNASAGLFQRTVLRASALRNTLPSEIRRLVADFAGVSYRAAVAQWVEEVERGFPRNPMTSEVRAGGS